MILIIFAVVSLFAVLVYFILIWRYGYWKKHGIPHEVPIFFYGNLKEVISEKKHLGQIFTNFYRKFSNASYYGFYSFRNPVLVIKDPELIKTVLVKDYNCFFTNGFLYDPVKDALLEFNPFFHTGDTWKQKRAQWSAVLTPSRLKELYIISHEKSMLMVEYLNNHITEHKNEPIEARELAVKFLTDIAVSGILGMEINTFVVEDNIFRKIALSFFATGFWESLTSLIYSVFPEINAVYKRGHLKNWVKAESYNISKNIVTLKKKHGLRKNDFFESCLREHPVNYADIAARVVAFLPEIVETSSALISFALYELAANPHIQTKLRKELDDAANQKGTISFENIHNLKYLDMIMNETLRLYPPVQTLHKQCTVEYELPPAESGGKNFTVPVGMSVAIGIYSLHHDPQYFPNPDVFDPERFRDERNIKKYTFLPFGEGPRVCVGSRLAMTNSKAAIASIVRNFELRIHSKTQPRPLPISPNDILTTADGKIWLMFRKHL